MHKAAFFYRALYRIQSKPCYVDVSLKTKPSNVFKNLKPEMQLQLASQNDWRAHPMLPLLAVHYVFSSSFPGFLKSYPAFPRYSHAGLPCTPNISVSLFIQVFIPVKPFEEGFTKMQDPLSSHLGGALLL